MNAPARRATRGSRPAAPPTAAHRRARRPAGAAAALPRGILPVLQTPFDRRGALDLASLRRLVDAAVEGGAVGLLAPAVASEVAFLTDAERATVVRAVVRAARGRVPVVAGGSADDPAVCRRLGRLAARAGAAAWLVAVPERLYRRPRQVVPFFRSATRGVALPLIVQDLDWTGPGLPVAVLAALREAVPAVAGFKIETVPAGPKYTAVREALGPDVYLCGGWAVTQMIEALDRGVDGMVPEASMVPVYARIAALHAAGARPRAVALFRRLLPVLAFTNQEIRLSIAFFKALLVRKGTFRTEAMRWPGFAWDRYNRRIAEELIEHYLAVEASVRGGRSAAG